MAYGKGQGDLGVDCNHNSSDVCVTVDIYIRIGAKIM